MISKEHADAGQILEKSGTMLHGLCIDEAVQLQGFKDGEAFGIFKTARLNDLMLCGRQDITDIKLWPSIFGKECLNLSIVVKLDRYEDAVAKLTELFPNISGPIESYFGKKYQEMKLTEKLRTASESEM